jgi:hypothetical protein
MNGASAPRPLITLGAFALAVAAHCGAAMGQEPPLPPPRPAEIGPAAPAKPALRSALQMGPEGAGPACLAELIAGGAGAEAAATPAPTAAGCGIAAPVRLSSVTLAGGGAVSFPDRPLLECAFALVLADYIRLIVAPLGEAILRSKVVSIETGPGYECRGRDRIAGAKVSAHGKGLAADFVAIEFDDKRRVLVAHHASADETFYFRAIRMAACGWFMTVLGPGADAFHADNMHLDIESHGSNGSYRICE